MDFEYSYDDNTYTVRIDGNSSGEYKAVIADKKYEFNASDISPNEFSILMDKKNTKAYVAESDDTIFVHIGGSIIHLKKSDSDNSGFGGAGGGFGAKDEISTPMPGKVVKILVGEGDRVEAGQSLVIVESMKMENPILAPVGGTIAKIDISSGQVVEAGNLAAIIEY